MKLKEYDKVKDYTYLQYCDYLQKKYGLPKKDYMSEGWVRHSGISRTSRGLVVHHKCEDRAEMLSSPERAMEYPYEYQKRKNLVFCDYLEHLFLHILICEYPEGPEVGYKGIYTYLVPEINDWYSGFEPDETWRKNCKNAVANDEDVYLLLIERFMRDRKQADGWSLPGSLCCSMNKERGGLGHWKEGDIPNVSTKITEIWGRIKKE